jgi:hypothetical protein
MILKYPLCGGAMLDPSNMNTERTQVQTRAVNRQPRHVVRLAYFSDPIDQHAAMLDVPRTRASAWAMREVIRDDMGGEHMGHKWGTG